MASNRPGPEPCSSRSARSGVKRSTVVVVVVVDVFRSTKMNIWIILSLAAVVSADESCHSYAEGNVYPRESIHTGSHAPQLSKVQSKRTIIQVFMTRSRL